MNFLTRLIKDPPPRHLFEISEAGIAYAREGQLGFEPLEDGVLEVSPVRDNVRNPDAFAAALARIVPQNGTKKRRPAAVILPDYAARVAVLDFDSFPSTEEEQKSLVRFRMKKSTPFDIDSAAIGHHVQSGGRKDKIEVAGVAVALEIVARYEALFRAAGLHPGSITTSALSMLSLYPGNGASVLVKLSGRTLAVMVIQNHVLKLIRTVRLESGEDEEVLGVLRPTLAYVEDELKTRAEKLVLCGFGRQPHWGSAIPVPTEQLQSRAGTPGPYNAGLIGMLETMEK
jgi:type IV pilus assembly protein PilM